jgi:hypothetical protein
MRRDLLARLPLPMLALSAAYGVWQFQALFVPFWVAALSALAFEATYLALAFAPVQDARRAVVISIAAVAVSVLYNTLSSLFHIRPALLEARPVWADLALAALHGAPLAIVAYAVADLVLHTRQPAPDSGALVACLQAELAQARSELGAARQQLEARAPEVIEERLIVAQRQVSVRRLAKVLELPESTVRRKVAQLEEAA